MFIFFILFRGSFIFFFHFHSTHSLARLRSTNRSPSRLIDRPAPPQSNDQHCLSQRRGDLSRKKHESARYAGILLWYKIFLLPIVIRRSGIAITGLSTGTDTNRHWTDARPMLGRYWDRPRERPQDPSSGSRAHHRRTRRDPSSTTAPSLPHIHRITRSTMPRDALARKLN